MGATLYRTNQCCKSYTSRDYILKTLVPDWADPPGADIAPYPRIGDLEGDVCPNADGGGTGEVPCGPWPFALIPTTAGSFDLFHEGNQFDASEDHAVVVTICDEPGFKCAQTTKQWHGMLPLTFCEDGCTELTTRYRTIDIQISGVVRDNDDFCGNVFVYDERRTWTVDRYSGKITLANKVCNSWMRTQTSPGVWENITQFFPTFTSFVYFDPCDVNSKPAEYDSWDEASDNISHSLDKAADSLEWHILNAITPAPGQCSPIEDQEYVTGDGKLISAQLDVVVTLSDAYTPANVRTDTDAAIVKWEFPNNLLFPWRSDTIRSLGVIARYNELPARSPDLGSAGCDTMDDLREPINDGSVDPFEPGWVPTYEQMAWFDLDAYEWIFDPGEDYTTAAATELRLRYDGAIIGQPFKSGSPTGLPDHQFSWSHITWACYEVAAVEHWEARRHGAYAGEDATLLDASDLLIPKSAPLWTENYPAGFLLPGSWITWNTDSTALAMQKQIELTIAFDAYNRFGPCGYHRFSPDVDHSSLVNSYSGTSTFATGDTINLLDAIGNGTYPVVVFGGANTPKIFSATVTGLDCVLGAEDTNARNVADAVDFWVNAVDANTGDPINLGDGVIAKVRIWQRSAVTFAAPPICGKVLITGAVQAGGEVVLTVATKYTKIGDKIICVESGAADTNYATNGGAGFTLTAASDTELRYTGTLDAAWIGKYIKSLGAPLASFNTTARRRQFVWQEWLEDATTGDFAATPTNTDDSYTGTRILGCTPNVATDTEAKWATIGIPSGDGYDFPATPTATTCGGKALVIPIQFVTDPLFQTPYGFDPIVICVPKVEAITAERLTTESAPALPDGCTFGLPTTPPVAAGTVCATGMPGGHSSPWSLCTPP